MNSRLRYRISQWEQAVKCKSNLSDKYVIHVSSVDHLPYVSGKLIQVEHKNIGVVFSVLLDPKGVTVEPGQNLYPMSTSQILHNLKCFGFDIQYQPEASLPEEQREYLREIQNLRMDKIRILNVIDVTEDGQIIRPVLTAFTSSILNPWVMNTYTCTQSEFNQKCGQGVAMRLDTKDFDWSWLTYVANIEDILKNK